VRQIAALIVLVLGFAASSAFSAEPHADIAMRVAKAPPAETKPAINLTSVADTGRPSIVDDPAREQALKILQAKAPEQRQKAAPFLRVAKPDPLETQRTVALKEQPVDGDAPVAATGAAPRPKLSKQ
jgi:hypothetical protein